MLYISVADRKIPSTQIIKQDSATRGKIRTYDNFDISISKKLYKASIHPKNIDPDKKDLFIRLFSIYSGITENKIRKKLNNNKYVVLSYNIGEKEAKRLKELAYKLNIRKVFREFEDSSGRVINYGLSIIESGEKRNYVYDDTLTPLVGYIKKFENRKGITKIEGVKGIEKFYDDKLKPIQDEYLKGFRDVGSNIILNREHIHKNRVDGFNINLNIPLKLQKRIENYLSSKEIELNAKEIIIGIMQPHSGKILTLATSNRFNPNHIKIEDYPSLNANAVENSFEAGSVLKPFIFSTLLDKELIKLDEIINTEDGTFKIGNRIITDDHRAKEMNMIDLIVHSSNIGMSKIAQRLNAGEYYQSLMDFGFNQKTEIDLPYENKGVLVELSQLQKEIYKATISYGYGIQTTFIQLLQAYNIFSNNGKIINPKLASSITLNDSRGFFIKHNKPKSVISPNTANIMKQILIENVKRGTGRKTKVDGIIVGGKTGTAHIAKKGIYEKAYNSSFFGFASDSNKTYTIGVTVYEPKDKYFASQTAVPIFKDVIGILVKLGYLKK